MTTLGRILKWGFLSGLGLLLLLIAAWAVSRAIYPTDTQRDAMAQLEQRPDYPGENAFSLLWTIDRDVPDGELETVMTEDIRRYSEKPPATRSSDSAFQPIESAAAEYPDLGPTAEDMRLFCISRDEDCLARVRENPDAYDALLERNKQLLDRAGKLQDFGHIQYRFPYRADLPLPSFQSASLLRTKNVVHFVQGRRQEALAGTCRNIATWRRLGVNSDMLITRLIGAAFSVDQYGHTLANMLSELPANVSLPPACDAALAAPGVDDVSICRAMRSEYGMMRNATKELPDSVDESGLLDRLAWAMLFDGEATLGMSAEGINAVCHQAERKRLRTDRREMPKPEHRSMWRFECLGNFIGCTMNAMAWPGYQDYRLRLQDYGAKLQVLGTLAWMRRHASDAQSPSQLLAARPDNLESPAREISFGPDGRTLRVPLYDTVRGKYWSIPLPPELHSTAND